jgi:hypothetical protein
MKTIESKINSIVDKILKEEMSTKVNSAVKRVNEKLEDNEDYTTKKTKTSKDEVDESMTIKPKGMGMNLKKKSFDLSEMEDSEMYEDNDMKDMYLGIGDHGFYDKDDRQMKDFDFDYDEEEYDDFDEFVSKYPNQNWFPVDDRDERPFDFKLRPGRKFWDMYKEKFGGPYKLRKRRPMGEEVDEMEENYKVAKERKSARTKS